MNTTQKTYTVNTRQVVTYGIVGLVLVIIGVLAFAGKVQSVQTKLEEVKTALANEKLETKLAVVQEDARKLEARNEEITKINEELVKEYKANETKLEGLYSDSLAIQQLMSKNY